MKNSCRRGYKKVGDTCKKILKRKISKKERNNIGAFFFGIIAYALVGEPLTKWINNTIISNGLRIFIGLVAIGMFYYFFSNE